MVLKLISHLPQNIDSFTVYILDIILFRKQLVIWDVLKKLSVTNEFLIEVERKTTSCTLYFENSQELFSEQNNPNGCHDYLPQVNAFNNKLHPRMFFTIIMIFNYHLK